MRRTKLTKDVISRVSDAIAIGATRELAAKYARVSVSSLLGWLAKAREMKAKIENGEKIRKNIFLELLDAVEDAEAEAGITWQQVLDKASKTDPAWAYKMLRLRYPDGYIDKDLHEVTGDTKVIIQYVNDWRSNKEVDDAEN